MTINYQEQEVQMLQFIYPCDPLNKRQPDEEYQEEFQLAKSLGISCSLYSDSDSAIGQFFPRPALVPGAMVIYRGWMLNLRDYQRLYHQVKDTGANLLTSLEQYQRCHHLPGWYQQCKTMTPETYFFDADTDFSQALAPLNWPQYFVKDYVKSLTTLRGSVAGSPEEVNEIVIQLKKYRGAVEGGICIRRFEALQEQTEERYFVYQGKAFARDNKIPEMVEQIAEKIDSPFFSIDIVLSDSGQPRLIELGDGQVSDKKKWRLEDFLAIFSPNSH